MIAESIHNAGNDSQGPFLDVPCSGLTEEQQREMIFGERGAVMQTQGGTLLIQDLEDMTVANQYRLYQLIRFHVIYGSDIAQLRRANVRVMVTAGRPIQTLVKEGILRRDLYYLLSGLELDVPPLRERKEDLKYHLDRVLKTLFERYARYHVLTKGATDCLLSYQWPGNLFQLESFCERLVLTAQKRSIDEITVRNLMKQLYRSDGSDNVGEGAAFSGETVGQAQPEKARLLLAALKRHGGNREKTAKELGISKATLWRHMQKYGIKYETYETD
jgi:DNA-binding NtrC family response regulator